MIIASVADMRAAARRRLPRFLFEYMDGGLGNAHRNFVKITDDSVEYGRQGKETWRIDRYTGTMTSSTFTIQFECQPRPTERKF